MSTSLETLYRLRAWKEGKPIPHGERINVHVADDDDLMILAFIRMGGESRPWGVAYGTQGSKPTILAVPDGRRRTLVADMMAEFGEELLSFFRHPEFSDDTPDNYQSDSARQVWLPGPTHVEMLHLLALAYARTRFERDDVELLRSLGNLANCLYIEQQRPGQQTVMSAAASLRDSYYFPSASIRQAHLGHLLGWLNGGKTRDERLTAATQAEEDSVATSLNPEVERRTLDSEVERWNKAQREKEQKTQTASESVIKQVLSKELQRRWKLTSDAVNQLRNDPRKRNPYLERLVESGAKSFYNLWGRRAVSEYDGESPYWPNVFTDRNPRTSASRFLQRNAESRESRSQLVHGDRELQREELAAGHGVIVEVLKVHSTDKRWTLKYSYPDLPTVEAGKRLLIAGFPENMLLVEDVDHRKRILEVKPNWVREKKFAGNTAPAAKDKAWEKRHLVLLDDPATGIANSLAARAKAKPADGTDIVDLIRPVSHFHAANDDEGPVNEPIESE